EETAIGTEGDRADNSRVALVDLGRAVAVDLPDENSSVGPTGGQSPTISTECNGADRSLMPIPPGQHARLLSGRRVVEPDRLINSSRGDGLAVRAESDRADHAGMLLDHVQFLAGCR